MTVKLGGLYRAVDRNVDSRAFDITNRNLSPADRSLPPEQIFAGPFAQDGRLNLFISPFGGQYDAEDRLGAGYAQVEMPLGGRLRVIGGARLEHWKLDLNALTPQGEPVAVERSNTDVLPSISLNYQLRDDQMVRLSASQTLSRPEYREISPTSSFEPIGGVITFGNTDLRRALIQNYDLRWEWYPRAGEVFSVAVFAKHFKEPIERVFVNQTGTLANSFVNAEGADNYGVELEARKSLDFLSPALAPLTLFANTTLMQSEITPGNDCAHQRRPPDGRPGGVRGQRRSDVRRRQRVQCDGALQRGRRPGAGGRGAAVPGLLRAGPPRAGRLGAGAGAGQHLDPAGRQEPAGLALRSAPGQRHAAAVQGGPGVLLRRELESLSG